MIDNDVMFLYSINRPEEKTLEETKRRFFATAAEIDDLYIEVHSQLKYIFSEMKKICDENNIGYFLMGGSCIGAMRAGKIIQWDLDGDIGMTRDDYARFSNIVGSSNTIDVKEVFKTVKGTNGQEYGTVARKIFVKDGDSLVNIDIFLWDRINISDTSVEEFWISREDYKYRYLSADGKATRENIDQENEDFLSDYGDKESGEYLIWGLDNLTSTRAVKKERVLKYETVFPLKTIAFLDDEYSICNDVDAYISQEWGDIWTLNIPNSINGRHRERMSQAVATNREILNARQ